MPLAVDSEAQKYYHEYMLPNGEHLPEDKQTEYTLNARVLNALREMRGTQKSDATCVQQQYAGHLVQHLRHGRRVAPSLRTHPCPRVKLVCATSSANIQKEGYACLVSGKFCNANTLKNYQSGRTSDRRPAPLPCSGLYDQAALRRIQPHRRTSRLETARFAVVAGAIPRTAGDQAAVVRRCLW